jgi:ATP-binding cassette subfamily B protein
MIDPMPETVFVKGIPVEQWDLQELRGLFGVVPQDSYLFSDSIRNNIVYGLSDQQRKVLSKEEELALIEKAVRVSAMDRDLENFPDRLDTVIGERGLTLSGGQKQRVAIARAVIGDPEFLILDDALSAVDAETAERILSALLEDGSRTIILVSHRRIAQCDWQAGTSIEWEDGVS